MADGATVVGGLDEARTDDEAWVIGGAQIYALALPAATRCEVTEVDIDLRREDGDAVAPVLDESWVGTTGDWLSSSSGLRYRFHSYHPGMSTLDRCPGPTGRASRPRASPSRSHAEPSPARTCGG